MKRAWVFGFGAAISLGACASQPQIITQIDYRGAAPDGAQRYAPPRYLPPAIDARPSEAHVLYVCNSGASNGGELGPNGQVLAYTPAINTGELVLWRNPTEGACLSSGYGWRERATGGGKQHKGIDLANPNGGYIFAAADGRVISAGLRGDYGLTIEIDHGHGVSTMYAHLSELVPGIARGARAVAGTPIGRMGATGNATGVHLHYEITVHGQLVDPLTWGAVWASDQPVS